MKEGDLLDESTLKEDKNLISEKYLGKGYWNSSVDVSVDRGDGKVPVNIQYKIIEGEKELFPKFCFLETNRLSQKNYSK